MARYETQSCPVHERVDEIQSALSTATERVRARLMEQAEAISRLSRTGRSTDRRLDAADRKWSRSITSFQERVSQLEARVRKVETTAAQPAGILDVSSWSVDHVIAWLTRIGLAEHYAHTFREHEIDGQTLCELDDSAWQTLGIVKLGHQSILRRAIAEAVTRQDAQEVGTDGDTSLVAVGRRSEDVGLLQQRVDELGSAMSAASARIEALEVDLAMKQTIVAASQAAAERRMDLALETVAQSASQISKNKKQIARLSAVAARSATDLDAVKVKLQCSETMGKSGGGVSSLVSDSTVNVKSWSVDHVIAWLTRIGLAEHYAHTFREHEIDGQTLCELDDSAWQTLGIVKLGHQSILRRAIAEAVTRQDAQEVGTDGDTSLVAVGRRSEDVGLLQQRVDELGSAMSAASARIEALEVDLAMKQTIVAASQAAAERRIDVLSMNLSALSEEHAITLTSLQRNIQVIEAKQDRLLDVVSMMKEHADSYVSFLASVQIQNKAAIEGIVQGAASNLG